MFEIPCSACLASDRQLYDLNNIFYQKIWKNIVQKSTTKTDVLLCWECLAVIKNVWKFQNKVQIAQDILKNLHKSKKTCSKRERFSIKSLSSLATTKPTTDVTISADEIENKSQEIENKHEDIKQDVDVKLENNLDDCNTVVDSDPEFLEDYKSELDLKIESGESSPNITTDVVIKVEKENTQDETNSETTNILNCTLNRRKKKTKPLNSKLENGNNMGINERKKQENYYGIKRNGLYKLERFKKFRCFDRIPVTYTDYYKWLERERHSEFFKRLKFKCDQCVSTVTKKNLNYHKTLHNKYKIVCDICQLSFPYKGLLFCHMKKHTYIKGCKECHYKCIDRNRMHKHVFENHYKPARCLQCDETFRSAKLFYEHYKESHTGKLFVCDYCNLNKISRRALEKHIQIVHMDLYCKECNKAFKRSLYKRKHMAYEHVIERSEATYCVQCDRQYDSRSKFLQHLADSKAHAAERAPKKKKLHPCPAACGKMYAKRVSATNHYNMVHAGVYKFRCDDCDRIFINKGNLQDHLKCVHQGFVKKKDKICEHCGRGFAFRTALRKHVLTHTGERPHRCPHCEATFVHRYLMTKHVKKIHAKS